MTDRVTVSTGTEFEEQFGYSRVVRHGNHVWVSGTAPIENGEIVGVNNATEQATYVIETVIAALAEVDASATDVVMTRIYVLDFDIWEAIAPVHRSAFGDAQPACTLVEVENMPADGALLELEARAVR